MITQSLSKRAGYSAPVDVFVSSTVEEIIGGLAASSNTVEGDQMPAWQAEIEILRAAVRGVDGHIFLEFEIPRVGRRIDAVLWSSGIVIPIEFKVGEREFNKNDIVQVWDYGLDLKYFHEGSHALPIFPVLIATEAPSDTKRVGCAYRDGVFSPSLCSCTRLRELVDELLTISKVRAGDPETWASSPYHPTPTIIEAAQALYARHSVEAITRHEAGATNLSLTANRLEEIIAHAQSNNQKVICFVTGVPGAGKTLVGLNLATRRRDRENADRSVFLSGNGPLVAVLQEALIRDERGRLRKSGQYSRLEMSEASRKIRYFIQNVHHFGDEGLNDPGRAPFDHVVVFDEAQRAWNAKKTIDFMRRRKNRKDFDQSEPEYLISYLDRHEDWAVVVCLVGGGQEIHDGEAGIGEWIMAVRRKLPHWWVYISPELNDSEFGAGAALQELQQHDKVCHDPSLHLAVAMRSYRAENVSRFVKELLDLDVPAARNSLSRMADRFPIAVTRDLGAAKLWLREHARGSEKVGLVASSEAARLKPHAIDIRVNVDPIHYFLNPPDDTRSSDYLEDAATEFQVQGLELDWVCVTWDGDLRFSGDGWRHHSFRGAAWQHIHKRDRQQYLKNTYRVLLTRARQGMVIFIPEGDQQDITRHPSIYDSTFNYLKEIGLPVL
ncbi:MAG TPA: DUF2075 domain-containing protein [Kiritimatiellia bacterium]|nr:DUF2075 domain-containing protein [Kiritimatiellia bacterium]